MITRELALELTQNQDEQFHEDERRLLEYVNYIMEWLKKQPHLSIRTDPQWIVAFLRGCKYSLERTKEKIDAYYTIRTHIPEWSHRDPKHSKIHKLLKLGIILPLPLTVSSDGSRVILMRPAIYDPKKFTGYEMLQVYFMVMDFLLLDDDRMNVAGHITIVDLAGSCLEHVSQYTPTLLKKSVTFFQEGYPIKTKSMHFINPPPAFDAIFSISKRFMKEKLRKRIMVHNEVEKIFEFIPKRVFPSDYGGDSPSVIQLTQELKKKVIEKRDWFIEDSQYRVTESKRAGTPITGLDLFGLEGSFKQLEFD